MGYSTEEDQKAAYLLSNLIKRKFLDPKVLDKKVKGKQNIGYWWWTKFRSLYVFYQEK